MVDCRLSSHKSHRLIDLLWQKEVLEVWLTAPGTPEEIHEQLKEQLDSVEKELQHLRAA
jgi:hypothetical protein